MQLGNTKQVIVLGDINADMTLHIPAYPSEGDDSTATALRWGSGGTGQNAATMFAHLGGVTHLLGRVGTDPAAQVALQAARQTGVDLTTMQYDAHTATGICSVVVSHTGQRTFFSFRGANVAFTLPPTLPALLDGADLLYISAYALLEGSQQEATLQAIAMAAGHVPIALDLSLPPIRHCRSVILNILPQIWLLCMNEAELQTLFPHATSATALDILRNYGASSIAIKRGAAGCLLADAQQQRAVTPPSVVAIDTNGCGDAFAAGCAWALLHNVALHQCAVFANTIGALTATRVGSADALPTHTELTQWVDPSLRFLLGT